MEAVARGGVAVAAGVAAATRGRLAAGRVPQERGGGSSRKRCVVIPSCNRNNSGVVPHCGALPAATTTLRSLPQRVPLLQRAKNGRDCIPRQDPRSNQRAGLGNGDCNDTSSRFPVFSLILNFWLVRNIISTVSSACCGRLPALSSLAGHHLPGASWAFRPRSSDDNSSTTTKAAAVAVPSAQITLPAATGAVAPPAAAAHCGNRAREPQQQRQGQAPRRLVLHSLVAALLFTSCYYHGSMTLCTRAASAVALCGTVAAAAPTATAAGAAPGSARAFCFDSGCALLTAAAAHSSVQLPPTPALEEDSSTTGFRSPFPSPPRGAACPSSSCCHISSHPRVAHLTVEHHSCFAERSLLPPPPLPPAFLSSLPTAETQGILAAASAVPPVTTRAAYGAGAGRPFRSGPGAIITAEFISPQLSALWARSPAGGLAAAVSAKEASTAAAAAVNTVARPPKAGGAHPVSVDASARQPQNLLTVITPSQDVRNVKAAATATAATPLRTTAASLAAPLLRNFFFIPPVTSFFFKRADRRLSVSRLPLRAREAQHARRQAAATTRPAATRTLTAAANLPASHSSTPSPLRVSSRSWLSSAFSPLWLSSPPVHTPRGGEQRLYPSSSSSSSSTSAACGGSAGVRGAATVVAAAAGPALRPPAVTACGVQKSKSAAAPVLPGGPTFPPLCAGCSSLVPSFIMAAAASAGETPAAAVEAADKGKQVVPQPTKHRAEKFRRDYRPPDFLIDHVNLVFALDEEETKVTCTLELRRRPDTEPTDLVLDGEDLTLLQVILDGNTLVDGTAGGRSSGVDSAGGEEQDHQHQAVDKHRRYWINDEGKLVIPKVLLPREADKKFTLMTDVHIHPKANLKLMGLYKSGRYLVTQCEAEGFRRITYFIDRPDVMALYRVQLIADKKSCPTLLSNGNQVEAGEVDGQPEKHYAIFEDPFPKPCYLFALVAGDLVNISQTFTTLRGREVSVRIFSDPQDSDKLEWAMQSLLKAMRWDEERFGLEYDLNIYNVVCAADFNMGAMENKSLNIFNSALLLAHPKTSTDANYEVVLSAMGHEYFHNWTGNRVTCRDWFQLTLKEGLTVFREQLFTADMFSAAVKRIEDVRRLRSTQFVEDSGPMAHPIRPESYVAIDNFYTTTVYSKGAEVIRMYHTLLGERGFRRGMDLYFRRHDGHAVTCDDFRNAMADANNKNLKQFELWYSQAGTPHLEVLESKWLGPNENGYTVTVKQSTPPTPRQPHKKPLHIPIKFGLIGKQSRKDVLSPPTQVLELTSEEQTFVISGVTEDCVLSFLRDFSAPVKVKYPGQTEEDIAFLMAYDSDGFSKWQAAYTLASEIVRSRAVLKRDGKDTEGFPPLPQIYVDAFRATLLDKAKDKSVQAYTLRLPDMDGVAQDMDPIDPDALYAATQAVREEIYTLLYDELLQVYKGLAPPATETEETRDQDAVARRRLRNVLLYFLTAKKDEAAAKFAMKHFTDARGMTDRFAALAVLVDMQLPEKKEALDIFYRDAEGNPLVLNKWFALQAMSECPDTIDVVRRLQSHPDFTWTNPNRLRALVFTFSRGTQFHNLNGEGYRLVADSVLKVDRFNPQVAAHGAGAFLQWRRYGPKRQELMLEELRRIRDTPELSPDTKEIVDKALADDPALTRSAISAEVAETEEKQQTHSKQE